MRGKQPEQLRGWRAALPELRQGPDLTALQCRQATGSLLTQPGVAAQVVERVVARRTQLRFAPRADPFEEVETREEGIRRTDGGRSITCFGPLDGHQCWPANLAPKCRGDCLDTGRRGGDIGDGMAAMGV